MVFLSSVFGFLPNWSSNGDSFILECGFSLRFPNAFLTESFNPKFSERNVFTRFLIDPIGLPAPLIAGPLLCLAGWVGIS